MAREPAEAKAREPDGARAREPDGARAREPAEVKAAAADRAVAGNLNSYREGHN